MMEHAEILHRCFRCGYCKLPGSYHDWNCPPYLNYRFESYAPGGRLWLLRAWRDEQIDASERFQQIMFSCAACGNCVEHCAFPKFKGDLLKAMIAGREELVNEGRVPPLVAEYFKAVHMYGNAYKQPESERGAWAEGLGVPAFEDQEWLLFVGDAGSYDERGQKSARAVASVLQKLGVPFGVLGERERCDGNEVHALGEKGLFELLAKQNIEAFKQAGVKKIVTVSPHGFAALKNEYPQLGGDFQVVHYTQLLAMNLAGKSFKDGESTRVAFHDPCYLGRHNQDYFTPRAALGQVPGVELVEMDRARADALCCGGGGGNFFTDVLGGGADQSSRARAREAADTGAEVLAVACPKCAKMLEDAVKVEGLEGSLRVMDVAEVVGERL